MVTNNNQNDSSTGFQVLNSSGTMFGRTITGSSTITVTNGDGISGNPSIATTGSATFTPNSLLQASDDFILQSSVSIGQNSSLTWASNIFGDVAALDSAHPGILRSTAHAGNGGISAGSATNMPIILGGGDFSVNWVFNLNTLSGGSFNYTLQIGLSDSVSNVAASNGCYFEYTDSANSGKWVLVSMASSVSTSTNSSTTATTGWHNFQINVNSNASLVTYILDGTTLGTNTLHIPSAPIAPSVFVIPTVGTTPIASHYIDLCYFTYNLTTAR